MTGMEASRHLVAECRTMSVCGMGYAWPSSISLTADPRRVTCPDCRRWIVEAFAEEEEKP